MDVALVAHVRRVAREGVYPKHGHPDRLIEALRERKLADTPIRIWDRLLLLLVKVTHVFEDLTIAISVAVLAIETVFEYLALGVEFVDNGLRIAALVLRKDAQLAQLVGLVEELPQMWPLVDVDHAPVLFVL